ENLDEERGGRGGVQVLRGSLCALFRAGPGGGPAGGAHRPQLSDGDEDRGPSRARRGEALGALLRPAAQGCRVLEQRLQDVHPLRRRRHRGEEEGEDRGLDQPAARGALRCSHREPGGVAAGEGPKDGPVREQGASRVEEPYPDPLRAGGGDHAPHGLPGGDGPGDPGPRRALGRQGPSRWPEGRGDTAPLEDLRPRPDGRGLSHRPWPGRGGGGPRTAQRALVRPRAGGGPAGRGQGMRAVGGPLAEGRVAGGLAPGARQPRPEGHPRARGPRGPRLRRDHRRQVPLHLPPLRGGREGGRGDGRTSRPGARGHQGPHAGSPPARHRQARRLQPHPGQARQPHRRGARGDQARPEARLRPPLPRGALQAHRRDGRQPPREARRLGL
ncbi:MAG: Response regulator, partial [uncultured Rubrobacteraceae bacterium]